jgi:hypothetical protein
MNKHIELVKKWLADNDSVTQQELEDNADAADCAYDAAYDDADYAADVAAANAANAAYTAYAAAYYAAAGAAVYAASAEYWVKRYEEQGE